jgi:hypothetical protein
MHPRMLARQDCSGGTCPAVYDDDPDLMPDELAIVGKQAGAGLRARLADHIAPDEVVGVIRREIVEAALIADLVTRPAAEAVTLPELQAQFETFSYSAFRLEHLQHYAGTARDDQWVALLKANRRWGKTHQRVHVIAEPLAIAMQEELTDGYAPNVAAGEDIRIIPTGPHEWPGGIPHADFWLFDSSKLYMMRYEEADGTWIGASRVTDPSLIVEACQARDAALHRAVPWNAYIASRPDLQRRLAQ